MRKQLYDNGKKIVEDSADLMRRFSAHYIVHLGNSQEEISESWSMLRGSAELFLAYFHIYRPLITNENDLERALAIIAVK